MRNSKITIPMTLFLTLSLTLFSGMGFAEVTCSSAFDTLSQESIARIHKAEKTLRKTLTQKQSFDLIEAHEVGRKESGKNQQAAGLFNYSFRQLLRKARILKAAGFDKAEIRKLMEAGLVGTLTSQQISDAVAAESAPPSSELIVRASGTSAQYEVLDSPAMYGKKIMVRFYPDALTPGADVDHYPVPQMVLTKDYLDPASQQLVVDIKQQSLRPDQAFQEVAGWILYTNTGVYRSRTITSGDSHGFDNGLALNALSEVQQQAKNAEGSAVKFVDVELYHTHAKVGEAFSDGDLDWQKQYFFSHIRKTLAPGGKFSSYAIPIQGRALFKSSVSQEVDSMFYDK